MTQSDRFGVRRSCRWSRSAAAAAVLACPLAAGAALAPYGENFDQYNTSGGDVTPAGWTETSTTAYAVTPAGAAAGTPKRYRYSGGVTQFATVNITNLANQPFRLATDVTPVAVDAANANVRIGLLANEGGFTTGYGLSYGMAGAVGAFQIFEGSSVAANANGTMPMVLGHTYRITADVTYAGSVPTIVATISDLSDAGVPTRTATFTDSASPAVTGTLFGYRSAISGAGPGGTTLLTVEYDNFSVPEPGAASAVLVGALGLLARRRR